MSNEIKLGRGKRDDRRKATGRVGVKRQRRRRRRRRGRGQRKKRKLGRARFTFFSLSPLSVPRPYTLSLSLSLSLSLTRSHDGRHGPRHQPPRPELGLNLAAARRRAAGEERRRRGSRRCRCCSRSRCSSVGESIFHPFPLSCSSFFLREIAVPYLFYALSERKERKEGLTGGCGREREK